jgi:hypothetical protein
MPKIMVEARALEKRVEKLRESLEEIQAKSVIKRQSSNQAVTSKALIALVLTQQADWILRQAEQTVAYCTVPENYDRDVEEQLDTPVFNALNLLKQDIGLECFNDKPSWLAITRTLVQVLDAMVSRCYRELEGIAQIDA